MNYNPLINNFICDNNKIDFFKVLENDYKHNLDKNLDSFKNVFIATSAMVNAYARVFMNKIKLEIIKKNGKIYYSYA